MERSEWPDDDAPEGNAYPPAPLPAHERTWRHPSEMGRAVWTHSEPPITIGRGLLITTGAIGGLLSLAVLWAMLPSAGRDGVAGPTVVTSTANNNLPTTVITARPDTLVATSVDVRLPATTLRTGSVNTSASQDSSTTTLDGPEQTLAGQGSELIEAPVAVGIGDSLVITTARAVQGRTSITLTGPDGQPHEATVLMVDPQLGLAVLSADAAAMTTSYGIGPIANPGDVVTVLTATPTSANVSMDAEGHLTLDTWETSTAEGTPVLNKDGLLVGMCTRGSSGPQMISVASVGAMLPAAKPAKPSPWMGVKVVSDARGVPTVDRIDPDGPAAAVGLVAGDIVTAVDGVAVSNVETLKAAVAAHTPGDVITLTITHVDQTTVDLTITLATAPSM